MNSIVLRALNDAGIERFRDFLDAARAGGSDPPPLELLSLSVTSEEVLPQVVIDSDRTFASRMELGEYLQAALQPLWASRSIDADRGLWTALSLIYFDAVCPVVDGARTVKNEDRYILLTSWDRLDRHLMRTPFVLTQIHGSGARVALSGKPHVFSEAVSQLTNRQQVLTNVPLFRALGELYLRPDGKLKTGASSKGAGTLRRLGKVLRQFDLTYDLHAMSVPDILALFPREFDRFKTT